MTITTRIPFTSCAILEISGQLLGDDSGDTLMATARGLHEHGARRLIVDLRSMTCVDFRGLCMVRDLVASWRARGGVCVAVGPSDHLESAIAAFKLGEAFGEFHPSVEAVIEAWLADPVAA